MSFHPRTLTRRFLIAGVLLVVSGMAMLGVASAQDTATPEVTATVATPEVTATVATPEAAAPPAATQEAAALPQNVPALPAGEKPSDAYCLLCHSQPNFTWTLPSGETLSLTVDAQLLADSVHGTANQHGALQCADCHTNMTFPHPPEPAQTIREFQLERYASCESCHEEQATRQHDSVHAAALASGTLEAATCVDCHGSHDIQQPDVPRQRISLTCGKCHGAIFEQYRASVHGEALLVDGNPDVPTCIDCHGVHNISDPTTALFRVRSPELCAKCHTDSGIMDKYGITTNVFDSYLTDFHGTTVAMFQQEDPNVATNKAVCYDCHGVHDIAKVDASTSRVVKENLLTTCRQCHPGATADFPEAWVGHFPPTLESHPLLFLVNTFYAILIPLVIAGFVFLVATDIYRRSRRVLRGRGKTGE
jgi:predicted CXXCH cytochrome family protein